VGPGAGQRNQLHKHTQVMEQAKLRSVARQASRSLSSGLDGLKAASAVIRRSFGRMSESLYSFLGGRVNGSLFCVRLLSGVLFLYRNRFADCSRTLKDAAGQKPYTSYADESFHTWSNEEIG
jgi:hypothetical protein